jgi:uncharacterized repeat protein (TIGR03803 family)
MKKPLYQLIKAIAKRLAFVLLLVSIFSDFSLAQAQLWGTTMQGGTNGVGTIFSYDLTSGAYAKTFDFSLSSGAYPKGGVMSYNGKLYGMTSIGGTLGTGVTANGGGVLFEFDPIGNNYAILYQFIGTTGAIPTGNLIQVNGILYGMTSFGGANNVGVLFQFDLSTNTYSNIVDFTGVANGANNPGGGNSPLQSGSLIKATNGKLYGMTSRGGANQRGVIFEFDPSTLTYTKKHDFSSTEGSYPYGALVQASNGKFYGMTSFAGGYNKGTLFEYNLSTNTFTKKFEFGGFAYDDSNVLTNSSAYPYGSLIQGSNGKLYGVASGATDPTSIAIYGGILFEYDISTSPGYIINKANFSSFGSYTNPDGTLLQSVNGKLYGYTYSGGAFNKGTLFEYDLVSKSLINKHDFDGLNGAYPIFGAPIEIVKSNQAITFSSLSTVSVGAPSFRLSATSSSGLTVKYTSSDSSVAVISVDTVKIKGAGTTTITASQLGNSQYNSAADVQQVLTVVSKSDQTIAFDSLGTHTYGDSPVSLNGIASSGLAVSYSSSNPSVAFISGNLIVIKGAGSAIITASQPGNTYYNAASEVQQTITVNKGILHANADNKNKFYGDANPLLTISYIGFAGSDDSNSLDAPINISTEATQASVPGNYDINLSGGSDNNYDFIYAKGTLNVAKATITATADNKSKSFGASNPVFTTSYSGFKLSDNLSSLDTIPVISCSATQSSAAGTYPITLSGGSDNNYIFNLVNGTLTITGSLPNVYATSPKDGTTGTNINVAVTSLSVTGATTYTIDISSSSDFSGGVTSKSGVRSQAFTGLSYGTTYYVRVKTDLSSLYGKSTSFTTAPAEYFSYITNPVNGAIKTNANLTMYSTVVTGATTYTIELSTDNFATVSMSKSGARSQTFSGLSYGTTYYARVKTDLSPNYGKTTTFITGPPEQFTYVSSPGNNSINAAINPKITSTLINGATTYTIDIGTDNTFSSGIISSSGPQSQMFNGLSYGTQYFARVKTDLSPNYGKTTSFTTVPVANLYYIAAPMNGATNVPYVTNITAHLVPNATQYTIELNPDSNFGPSTAIVKSSSSKTIGFTLDYNTRYYARVATDIDHTFGTIIKSFTTGDPLSLAYVTSPKNGGVGVPNSVTVYSNTIPGAAHYTIELNTASDFNGSSIVKTSTTHAITFKGLASNQIYYTRVQTDLDPGEWGITSTSFTTTGPSTSARSMSDWVGETQEEVIEFSRDEVNVYPIPFHDKLNIHVQADTQKEMWIQFYDLTGKEVGKYSGMTNSRMELPTSEMSVGIYVLKIATSEGIITRKVIRE